MIVRDIEEGDFVAWRRLFVDYGVFYETDFTDDVIDGVWTWLLNPDHEVKAVVAVDGGEVVGLAHYRRLFDTFTAGPGWFLDDLYVSPGARSGGIGTALIEAVSERARANGGGTLRWITAADNDRAQRVYDRIATRATWVTFEREID